MRRLRVLTVLAVMVPLGLIAVPSATGAAHVSNAKQPIETVVFTQSVKLVSSTGHALDLAVDAEADTFHNQPPEATADIFLADGTTHATEEHDWQWDDIANGDLLYDPSDGSGTFETDTQLGSWGSVDLTIAPKSAHPKSSCAGADQTWSGTISGTVWFDSHSAWGSFGTKQTPLTFSEPSFAEAFFSSKALNGCGEPNTQQHCNGQINWNDSGGWHGVVFGNSVGHNGKRGSQFDFFYTHTLDHGNGPQRDDTVFADRARPLKVVTSDKGKVTSVRIHAGTHGLITGAATLTSIGRPAVHKHQCIGGTNTEWDASYTPGANPLTVHMAIGAEYSHRAVRSGADLSIESG